jgi:hypothetical protein
MQSQSVHPFAQITCIILVAKDLLCSAWPPFLTPVLLRSILCTLRFGSEPKHSGDSRVEIAMAAQNGIRICLVFRRPDTAVGSDILV